jgi:hypothetical protein
MSEDTYPHRIRYRKSFETYVKNRAAEVYATFDKNERTACRFGMFPAAKMEAAQAQMLEECIAVGNDQRELDDIPRLLAVGIMDAANAGPDKVIV